jgi:hypothetical protein
MISIKKAAIKFLFLLFLFCTFVNAGSKCGVNKNCLKNNKCLTYVKKKCPKNADCDPNTNDFEIKGRRWCRNATAAGLFGVGILLLGAAAGGMTFLGAPALALMFSPVIALGIYETIVGTIRNNREKKILQNKLKY